MRILLLCFLLAPLTTWAQGNNRLLDQPMKLKNINIRIDANEFTARTFIEMEFYNPNNVEEEGLYYFKLAKGQAITGFQLDLHGQYRDGSIEERWKAENAYNTIVGKRIDPALLTMIGYNAYSLRIYPIPPKGTRKITMTIEQLLEKDGLNLKYQLPFSVRDTVDNISIRIFSKSSLAPYITNGILLGNRFENLEEGFHLEKNSKRIQVSEDIIFWLPPQVQYPKVCAKKIDSITHFAARYFPSIQKSFPVQSSYLTVYWDNSWSGDKRNTKKEIEFLKNYIEKNDVQKVQVITFNQQVTGEHVFNISPSATELFKFLTNLSYEGATQYGCLDFSSMKGGIAFLFSDGINAYGSKLPRQGLQPVYCIKSVTTDGESWFEEISGTSGGTIIDIEKSSPGNAIKIAGQANNKLLRVRSAATGINLLLHKQENENSILISGSFKGNEAELILEFGTNDNMMAMSRIKISVADHCEHSSVERIGFLENFDKVIRTNNYESVLNYARKEKFVSYNTSFIVLERIEDYMQFKILPPKDLEPFCDMNLLVKELKERDELYRARPKEEVLKAVVNNFNKRLRALDNTINPIDLNNNEVDNYTRPQYNSPTSITTGFVKQMTGADKISTDKTMMQEVVVTALGQVRMPRELGYSVANVRRAEFNTGRSVGLQQGLTGRVSGINVQTTNSSVFSDTRITLRGIRSLTGNNQPMLVLNGSPIDLSLVNKINPNDIVDVTILKSPAATAVYGPEGVNGALLINTKSPRYSSGYHGPYRYKNLEDMDYIKDMNNLTANEKFSYYKERKKDYGSNAAFYFDMAENLFNAGLIDEAKDVLFSAASLNKGNMYTLRAVGYYLEYWKQFPDAIVVYSQLVSSDSNNLYLWRDLALAHYQNNNFQEAVNTLHAAITRTWIGIDTTSIIYKASLLQEMNWIISAHKKLLDLTAINPAIIKSVPVDLQITVHSNKYNYTSASLVETDASKVKRVIRYGNELPEEYQVKNAGGKKFLVRVNYNDYYYHADGHHGIPGFIKLVCFKYPGTDMQQLEMQTFIMDNQSGLIDIAEIKLDKRNSSKMRVSQ